MEHVLVFLTFLVEVLAFGVALVLPFVAFFLGSHLGHFVYRARFTTLSFHVPPQPPNTEVAAQDQFKMRLESIGRSPHPELMTVAERT